MLKIATVCSGIGSPEMALSNLGIDHEISFACEIDKYARQSYLANFETKMMLQDMTKEDWVGDEYYADLFVGGIPCQSFSLAGKRLGEADPRGLLFYDFYRYVKNQQPKYFIIENVKGLLSDDSGNTFRKWKDLLGQSENGTPFFFPHEDSLMYNLHWEVLNTKDYGLPQNRERVFLVGIRNDLPNNFNFPKTIPLTKRLKDVLESDVDEKYYLSEKLLNHFKNKKGSYAGLFKVSNGNDIANCILATYYKMAITNTYIQEPQIGAMRGRNPVNPNSRESVLPTEQMLEINKNGVSNSLTSVQKDNLVIEPKIIVFCRTEQGKQKRKENFKKLNKDIGSFKDREMIVKEQDFSDTILANPNPQKDGLILEPQLKQIAQLEGFESEGRIYDANGISRTIKDGGGGGAKTGWYLIEQKYGNKTKRNAFKILCLLLETISEESAKEWKDYVNSTFQEDEILQPIVYEQSLFNKSNKDGGDYHTKQQSKSTEFNTKRFLRNLWKRECFRCKSQRRKSIKQLFREFTKTLQVLSYEETQNQNKMQIKALRKTQQGLWLLRKTLSEVQEIWKPITNQSHRSFRIRRLTPLEAFRLQGYSDYFFEKAQQVNSDTQLYRQAGNTISVPVIQALLKNLLKLETN